MSFLSAFGGVIKLIMGIVLVLLGYRAFSGLWAACLMTLGMFLLALFPLTKILQQKLPKRKLI